MGQATNLTPLNTFSKMYPLSIHLLCLDNIPGIRQILLTVAQMYPMHSKICNWIIRNDSLRAHIIQKQVGVSQFMLPRLCGRLFMILRQRYLVSVQPRLRRRGTIRR